MDKQNLKRLFEGYLAGEISEEEEEMLMKFIVDPAFGEELKSLISASWDVWNVRKLRDEKRSDQLFKKIASQISPVRDQRHSRKKWYMVAASIILLAGVSAYLLLQKSEVAMPAPLAETFEAKDLTPPASSLLTLTLGNGKRVEIDSLKTGRSFVQGNAGVFINPDGSVSYKGESMNHPLVYNTLAVPRGSKIGILTLSDGTKVWLNNESSITYPATFNEGIRQVKITGEAYFEVHANPEKPFIVEINNSGVAANRRIEVVGTRFNISSYADEPVVSATLLQGSLRVVQGGKSRLLIPGDQARLDEEGNIAVVKKSNTGQTVAWKDGYFSFENASLREVMKQLSRWYDIKVVFEGAPAKDLFSGEIGKSLSLDQVLNLLTEMKFKYKIEKDRKLIFKFPSSSNGTP